jgi:hypothetical protein
VKRYRLTEISFDGRPHFLTTEIQEDWEPDVKAVWQENRRIITAAIASEFGDLNLDQKLRDLSAIDSEPFTVIAFHDAFLNQVRRAFVAGAHCPALTRACALGERILNPAIQQARVSAAEGRAPFLAEVARVLEEVVATRSGDWRATLY